ncbi:hypothetical protein IAG41_07870 [Sphingomonas sp. JC676]|uniref:hypothetical protein n=1 Tax=Sphingomonas sp. JC676 TaxID=2768065 RepID=UPI001657E6F1|nr:hypothetical protein [Sphingomonas sp. JC676]MBC9032305.1 hypothetical protein [Sphingomonas sp. JC676]
MNLEDFQLENDDHGRVRLINHNQMPISMESASPLQAAQKYLHDVAGIYGIDAAQLTELFLAPERMPIDAKVSFRLLEDKRVSGSAVVSIVQTYFGLPVRYAGLDVVMATDPLRILSSSATFHPAIEVKAPKADSVKRAVKLTSPELSEILNQKADDKTRRPPVVNRTRLVVFRYQERDRQPHAPVKRGDRQQQKQLFTPPTLPLPPLPDSIVDGNFYVALEAYFTLSVPGFEDLHWVALIEVETRTILLLEALIDGVTGSVFLTDPITKSGSTSNSAGSTTSVLNGFRDSITLLDLNAPSNGTQALSGSRVFVSSSNATSPTKTSPFDFQYDSRTNDFSAVNAYHNCNRFFGMLVDMGFSLSSYLDGTTFPLKANHRFGNTVNANCPANSTGNGIGGVNFELADTSNTSDPLGSACDWRTVLHEIGGHGILYDHISRANLGFSHSQGDSFAAILNDPLSALTGSDRFITFPFTLFWDEDFAGPRRHDRAVATGWGWGGSNDNGAYKSEQILSTTLFRVYRSIGGDSGDLNSKAFAARFAAYLILKAVGLLTPTSAAAVNKTGVTDFAPCTDYEQKLESADASSFVSANPAETHAGGAYGKVIRWSFEKQGLFRASGDPVTSVGRPPAVDVYIDDGRAGEYQYQWNHWNCQDIWNRRAADGGSAHEEPIVGQTNYAYVRVKNRGSQTANNVVVRGYHAYPSVGLTYPDDWIPMTDVLLVAPSIAGNDSAGVVVGPFQWTPGEVSHECMFFTVYATGDPANVDGRITGSIPEWRLVPHDNNVAQRNVSPVPGGGGAQPLKAALSRRPFALYNPLPGEARIKLTATLPDFLVRLGWEVRIVSAGGSNFGLKPGIRKEVLIDVKQGGDFTREMVVGSADTLIHVTAQANGIIIGGMSFNIDPDMKYSVVSGDGKCMHDLCRIDVEDLLKCASLEKAKRVRVRKIVLEIDYEDDSCK